MVIMGVPYGPLLFMVNWWSVDVQTTEKMNEPLKASLVGHFTALLCIRKGG
ncbi:MAG: hypothetical protein ACI8WB_002116 [Phenylobacterium sp.]|jgi:hypothetical protein